MPSINDKSYKEQNLKITQANAKPYPDESPRDGVYTANRAYAKQKLSRIAIIKNVGPIRVG